MDTTLIDFPSNNLKKFIDKFDIVCTELIPEQLDSLNQNAPSVYVSKVEHRINNSLEKKYYNKLLKIADSSRYSLYNWQPYLDSVNPSSITQFLMIDKQMMRTKLFVENNYSPKGDFINFAKKKNIPNTSLETTEQWISYNSYFLGKNIEMIKG